MYALSNLGRIKYDYRCPSIKLSRMSFSLSKLSRNTLTIFWSMMNKNPKPKTKMEALNVRSKFRMKIRTIT